MPRGLFDFAPPAGGDDRFVDDCGYADCEDEESSAALQAVEESRAASAPVTLMLLLDGAADAVAAANNEAFVVIVCRGLGFSGLGCIGGDATLPLVLLVFPPAACAGGCGCRLLMAPVRSDDTPARDSDSATRAFTRSFVSGSDIQKLRHSATRVCALLEFRKPAGAPVDDDDMPPLW